MKTQIPKIGDTVLLGGESCVVIKMQGGDFVAKTPSGTLKGFNKNTPFSIVKTAKRKAVQVQEASGEKSEAVQEVAQPSTEEAGRILAGTFEFEEDSSSVDISSEAKEPEPEPEPKKLSFMESLFAKKKS